MDRLPGTAIARTAQPMQCCSHGTSFGRRWVAHATHATDEAIAVVSDRRTAEDMVLRRLSSCIVLFLQQIWDRPSQKSASASVNQGETNTTF